MNWTMPYPWRLRSDSVRRINMSSEPGNESFFCALRPIPRILSLRRRDYASQVQIGEPSRRKTISGVLTGAGCESLWRALPRSTIGLGPISTGVKLSERSVRVVGYAGPTARSRLSRNSRVAFLHQERVGVLILRFFEAQSPGPPIPLSTLQATSRDVSRKTEGQDGRGYWEQLVRQWLPLLESDTGTTCRVRLL